MEQESIYEVSINETKQNKNFYELSSAKCDDSKIYEVDEEKHPSTTIISQDKKTLELLTYSRSNKMRSRLNLPPLRIYPFSNDNLYTPAPIYNNVTIELAGGATWEFSEIQDDMGNDAGFAVDEKELKARLKETDLQAPFEYDWTHNEGQGTISICRVKIPNIGVDHFTVVIGIQNLDAPLIGRFMIGDAQNKLYAGYLSEKFSLPLNYEGKITKGTSDIVITNTYSLTNLPDWNVIIKRYRQSVQCQKLYKAVEIEAIEALKLYKQEAYLLALPHFQRCSVLGFFTHEEEKYRTILYNLASTYYQLKDKRGLHWAMEAQKIIDNDKVKQLITKFQQL